MDYVEVRHFGHTTVPATYTLDDQRALVSHFISLFHPTTPTAGAADGATGPTPGYPEQMLVMSAKHLIIPMLKQGLGKDEGLIDGGSLKALVTGVLEPMDQQPGVYTDVYYMHTIIETDWLVYTGCGVYWVWCYWVWCYWVWCYWVCRHWVY